MLRSAEPGFFRAHVSLFEEVLWTFVSFLVTAKVIRYTSPSIREGDRGRDGCCRIELDLETESMRLIMGRWPEKVSQLHCR
jgi:hypothetical protein